MINKITKSGVIAVVRNLNYKQTLHVVESLVKGGITGIEITVSSNNAFDSIKDAKKQFGKEAIIGAGTVLDGETARKAIEKGAEFIFAPSLNKETIQVSNRYGKIAIPGVLTPTEIVKAYEWGADAVKIFPASALWPTFIKDIKTPLDYISIVPTGGITLDNVSEYIQAGAMAVGIGGSLINKQIIHERRWQEITNIAELYTNKVSLARENM